MLQNQLVIERVSMPEVVKKGDKYLNAVMPICDLLTEVETSVFIPEADPNKNRTHYVHRCNKYGATIGKTFAVAIMPKNVTTEAKDDKGKVILDTQGNPKVNISVVKGVRVFLTGIKAQTADTVILPEETKQA